MATSDDSTAKNKSVQDPAAAERITGQTFDPQGPGKKPDQPQCDPGQKDFRFYTFKDGRGIVVASMLVPAVSGRLAGGAVSYARGTEYWFDVSTSTPSRSLTVSWEDHYWVDTSVPAIGRQSFTMVQSPTWTGGALPPAACATLFVGADVALAWDLQLAGTTWQGSLAWFNTSGQSDLFRGTMPTGGVTLSANTTAARVSWYGAAVAPAP